VDNEENIDDRSIYLNNVVFLNNKATSFGGAIYFNNSISYLKSIKNTTFQKNIAEVAGGAIFTTRESVNPLITNNELYKNNTSKAYGPNYAGFPAIAELQTKTKDKNSKKNESYNISSGNPISFHFIIKDIFQQMIVDSPKLHSNFPIIAELIEGDDTPYSDSMNNTKIDFKYTFILKNNMNDISDGECKINDLTIYSNPTNYKLRFSTTDKDYNITFTENDIPITITNCDINELKKTINTHSNYNITYCEKPKCKYDCNKGICLPKNEEHDDNYCLCEDGFIGFNCNTIEIEPDR